MKNLTEKALVGRKYLRSDLKRIDGYFSCLKLIKPLLKNLDYDSSTSGFYINVSGEEVCNVVRLTYFTNNQKETDRKISEFLTNYPNVALLSLADFQDESYESPKECRISEEYGGGELRFRNFLNTYTHIGLDLIDLDVQYSRRLVTKYRLDYDPLQVSPQMNEEYFGPVFAQRSNFFQNLEENSIKQLWSDLSFCHREASIGEGE